MDSELSSKISEVVQELAKAEQHRLRAAGTFIELEELASEIGDEVTRQLLGGELADRGTEADNRPQPCPTCDCPSDRATPHQRRLLSTRGEIGYHEPAFYCRYCRRSFFPGGGFDGFAGARHGDTKTDSGNGLGRKQPEQF